MGFLDKAKAAAEQATAKVQEGVEDVQAKRELGQAYNELGRLAFELVESHDISHPSLQPVADRIRALNEREKGDGADAPVGATADAHDPGTPPAPPS